jgi:hypothetical protein
MAWRHLSLYVDVRGLARDVASRTHTWRGSPLGPAAVEREARKQEVDEAIVRLGGGSSSSLNALSSSLNPSSLPPFSPFLLRSSGASGQA